ncbi:HpsJ-like protein, cyanoexosortase A-associated [Chamaesiphon minutus]|uniref:Uncharacterized protein n=1 Tax=Chamaesiphon minutus (strain ATCC 27169 / PCC 6605) TaxID=1173020 RepID=K9UBZ6_CHAP6|nr:HpsJ family protein [Chamaesiphon minutus]AFY91734.1 hypothetical protein Cha6605_0440 [Chamaesiphon minutus PCC 6605]
MTPALVLFRVVGYGLLLLTLFDVVSALVPPQFSNPGWQFQTAGGFVERSAVPLIGFILVFYGNQEIRKKREMLVLKGLSWIALVSAIFYFLLVVVFFVTLPTLNDRAQSQVSAQFDPRITQAQQIQTQLDKMSGTQVEALMKSSRVQMTDATAFKAKAMQEAATVEKNLKDQSNISKGTQRTTLVKSAVKWGLGALVTGVLFVRLWAGTAWARQ